MESTYLFITLTMVYLIGIPITFGIIEDPDDDESRGIELLTAIFWPFPIIVGMVIIIATPIYLLTKLIKKLISK